MAVLEDEVAPDDADVGHAVGDVFGNIVVAYEQELEVEIPTGGEQLLPVGVEFKTNGMQKVGGGLGEAAFALDGEADGRGSWVVVRGSCPC
jgi:hypothetical protein